LTDGHIQGKRKIRQNGTLERSRTGCLQLSKGSRRRGEEVLYKGFLQKSKPVSHDRRKQMERQHRSTGNEKMRGKVESGENPVAPSESNDQRNTNLDFEEKITLK